MRFERRTAQPVKRANRSGFKSWSLLAVALLLVGCRGGEAPPDTVRVTGRVAYQGRPLSTGTISFQPAGETRGPANRPATGTLDGEGRYELSSFRSGDGAVPGEYRVVIVSLAEAPSIDDPDSAEVWAIPERYGNGATSGLTASVPADGSGAVELNFELRD